MSKQTTKKIYNLELTDEERLVLKENLEGLVRVTGIMQRTVIGNQELANQLERGDQVLIDILKKVNLVDHINKEGKHDNL